MTNKTLNDYKQNEFSQYGEDGIIKEILNRLNLSSGVCVEFGAWDGLLLSNTANLWSSNDNWRGVLIEADSEKFKTLRKVTDSKNVVALHTFVKPDGKDSLEQILLREKISFDSVRLLSVDIDGNEFYILKNLEKLRPSIIVAEYNPTIPGYMEVVSKEDTFFGSSAKALHTMMKDKGYSIVAITKSNCIFVDSASISRFDDLDTSFESLFDTSNLIHLITGYDGRYAFSGQPAFSMCLPLERSDIVQGDLFFFKHSQLKARFNYLKDRIKQYGKLVLGANTIQKCKIYSKYIFWLLKGRPVPAHGLYKTKILKKVGKEYGVRVFVETGTAGGTMIRTMSNYFAKLYTIELSKTLYYQAKAFSSDKKNITFLQGDSGTMIKEILKELNEPALFWLDAHYSGSGTARGSIDTPIMQELNEILNHKIKNHVIIIDDIRDFNGTNDYPDINWLIDELKTKFVDLNFVKNNDLLIISQDILKK